MKTVEIRREIWVTWLNQFTIRHENRPVSVEIVGPDIGAQPEIDNLPLIGISADRVDHDGTIALSVAQPAGHLTHIIQPVTRIYVEQTDDGIDVAVNIESVDGTRTILRLPVSGRPQPPALRESAAAAGNPCLFSGTASVGRSTAASRGLSAMTFTTRSRSVSIQTGMRPPWSPSTTTSVPT